jgi:hypothetical protein
MPVSIEGIVQEMQSHLSELSRIAVHTNAQNLELPDDQLAQYAELFTHLPDEYRSLAIQSFMYGQFDMAQHII